MAWNAPKTMKCGEELSFRFVESINSEAKAFTKWNMSDAKEHAKDQVVNQYLDQFKKDVTDAANKWKDEVTCGGKSEKCQDEECSKSVSLGTDISEVTYETNFFYEFTGKNKEDGKVICQLKVYSGVVSALCSCSKRVPYMHIE